MKIEIFYKTNDGSIEVKLVYIVGRRFRNYRSAGKSYPKCTQCICFINGFIVGFGEVYLHRNDIDNPKYALKLVTKKAMSKINLKFIRKELWIKVLKEIEQFNINENLHY